MSERTFCKRCGTLCETIFFDQLERRICPECGFIYYMNPFACISVLVVDEMGRMLIGKRRERASIYPGKWCLPCGYIEYEETYLEAAVREVKEETGVPIRPVKVINVVSNQLYNGVNSVGPVVLAEPLTTDINVGDDMVDAHWFSVNDQLPDLAFESDRFTINEYILYKSQGMEMPGLDLRGTAF